MCGAVGSRWRRVRRQEVRCEGYCDAMQSALLTAPCPRQVTAIHMRRATRGARANEVMERHVRKKNGGALGGTSVPHQAVALVVA